MQLVCFEEKRTCQNKKIVVLGLIFFKYIPTRDEVLVLGTRRGRMSAEQPPKTT